MAVTLSSVPPELRDYPYVLRFSDGRSVAIRMPAGTVVKDRSGQTAFTMAGVRHIDRIRALFMPMQNVVSPGFVRTLRETLRMTQVQFGHAVGVDKMTVYRWEKGTLRPGKNSAREIDKLRAKMTRRGVLLGALAVASKPRKRV
jgi:DNA-binding transcriptional regulator YiaG